MMELVIIGCDIQEVLGTAIALQILFGLPLWVGCLITALDTLTFLAIDRCGDNKSNSLLHGTHRHHGGVLLLSKPNGIEITEGIAIPRIDDQNVLQDVGMLGSIIMRHDSCHTVSTCTLHWCWTCERSNFFFGLKVILALFVSFIIMFVISAFASTFYSKQCDLLGGDPLPDVYKAGIQTASIPTAAAFVSSNNIYSASPAPLKRDLLRYHACSATQLNSSQDIASESV
ncbi:Metal Ion (Mn2 -iron) Transporter [Phytophthora megakarya]|uniref:Metal Ion (Mn2-iron) Transporter n=1 Tax=Phytophthora megakarya TaxID=4795 RepID=A0A225UV10_9STRA|nr:Metal Ion (Mn2 -iron) Transporter [Phytophthora megakarya]